jgi:hypothetical protein
VTEDGERLVTGHPAHARFAVSDTHRLWIGEGTTLHAVDRLEADTSAITHMVMDAQGVLWLLTSADELQFIADDDIVEVAPPLPLRYVDSLYAGAGHIVVFGGLPEGTELPPAEPLDNAELEALDEYFFMAVSTDAGEWSLRRRPVNGSEFDDLAIAPDGSMMLMDGNENDCGGGGQERWQGHVTDTGWAMLPWPHDDPFNRVAASGGWSYRTCDDDERAGVCAVDPAGNGLFAVDVGDAAYAIKHTEGVTMLASGAGLWSLQASEAERIGEGHEGPFAKSAPVMAISQDRVILVAGARVYIGSATGWTELALA